MRIYYNKNTKKLLTEEEVDREIDNIMVDLCLQLLFEKFTDFEIWDMLKEDVKSDLYKQMKKEKIKEDYYYYRDWKKIK